MKYIVLVSSVLIQMCLGGLYAWSTFVPSLRNDYDLTTAQTQLIFGLMIAVFTVVMNFAGRMQEKWGPRPVVIISGILFFSGYLVASQSDGQFLLLLLGISVIAGAGTGFGYVCPLATCMKWFPKRKGLVTGITVGAFGSGAILLSWVVDRLMVQNINTLEIFRWIGIGYGLLILTASFFMKAPQKTLAATTVPHIKFVRLFKERAFWGAIAGMLTGTFTGLLIIGNLKPIALSFDFTPAAAALAITTFSIGNALGRICWGWIADRYHERTLMASLIFLAVSALILSFTGVSMGFFLIVSLLVGFGFGACFVLYATLVANRYGTSQVGIIYPLIFLAYGFSAIVGPTIGGSLYDLIGGYIEAIWISAAIAAIGAIIVWLLFRAPRAYYKSID
ncbi:MAG TPA: MFS transporter [Dehalococcoidales bacterium]|nr:MFS transporter [Dehalococcoidales bacterium]